jgi:hypothetical protein
MTSARAMVRAVSLAGSPAATSPNMASYGIWTWTRTRTR